MKVACQKSKSVLKAVFFIFDFKYVKMFTSEQKMLQTEQYLSELL
jgi:hypothetical protein